MSMAMITKQCYLEKLFKFVDEQAGALLDGTKVLKLNPPGLHYVHSRLEALQEVERLLSGAPVDYLRAYISDLGDHRALEQLRRILQLLTTLKVVSPLPSPARDPTPLSLLPFGRLKVLELRGCDLSTKAAKGLLELRHTLEKIICHNSTDALRHVFASRIAEIKGSPQWSRLSFVSCARNRLLLMDESLQLLPAVETLDLSRNKLSKVDNLSKCAKLKHLDLGFNHLRSISSFSEVSCRVVKLVLRNNALTTLRGIENLKSLKGLDVSYNIISKFSELEFLVGLSFLQSLWMEGNPLCCARWYRAHIFSYFGHPENLKLDDKEIDPREYWKRKIIVASRQKRPSSLGFYSPAKDEAEGQGCINRNRTKMSRLASIESEQESAYIRSDLDSVSHGNEIQSRDKNTMYENEAGIVDLMKRIEQMKTERSIIWLNEFKDWIDHTYENSADGDNSNTTTLLPRKENYKKSGKGKRHLIESSRCISDSIQANSDTSFANSPIGMHAETSCQSMQAESSHHDMFSVQGRSNMMLENASVSHLSTFGNIMESNASSAYPGSPPHYQKDLLHCRLNLVEEILQLSAESYSVSSADSDTSSTEDDHCESGLPVLENHHRSVEGHSSFHLFKDTYYAKGNKISLWSGNVDSCGEQTFSITKTIDTEQSSPLSSNLDTSSHDPEISSFVNRENDWFDKRKIRRKAKRRVVSLLDENNCQQVPQDFDNIQMKSNAISIPQLDNAASCSDAKWLSEGKNDFIVYYFNENLQI